MISKAKVDEFIYSIDFLKYRLGWDMLISNPTFFSLFEHVINEDFPIYASPCR